ncbi:MAG: hypothetical protein ACTSRW_02185 [Candidatus Helarchaeota archaeon]
MTIRIKLPEEIELKFREIAMKKYGFGKGSLTKAATHAIIQWIAFNDKINPVEKPTDELKGMLKNVKGTSLDLQHEASSLFLKR